MRRENLTLVYRHEGLELRTILVPSCMATVINSILSTEFTLCTFLVSVWGWKSILRFGGGSVIYNIIVSPAVIRVSSRVRDHGLRGLADLVFRPRLKEITWARSISW